MVKVQAKCLTAFLLMWSIVGQYRLEINFYTCFGENVTTNYLESVFSARNYVYQDMVQSVFSREPNLKLYQINIWLREYEK